MESLDRAVGAFFLTQVVFLGLGLFWTRPFFAEDRLPFSYSFLLSHLSFGIWFLAAQLLLVLVWRSGDVLVFLLSRQSSEVAFFNVANAAMMALSLLIIQASGIFIPSLTMLEVSGQQNRLDSFTRYALKYLTIGSFCCLFVVYAVGPWAIGAVMGKAYLPVADNLKLLALSFPFIALLGVGYARAVVHKQPGRVVLVNATALAIFCLTSAFLVPYAGSLGASAAMALAMIAAGLMACRQFSLASFLAQARFGLLLLIGLVPLALLVVLSASPLFSGMLVTGLFVALLFWSGVVNFRELRQIAQGLAS
jgi:O-antigen/teichoic acid export membrane protein